MHGAKLGRDVDHQHVTRLIVPDPSTVTAEIEESLHREQAGDLGRMFLPDGHRAILERAM